MSLPLALTLARVSNLPTVWSNVLMAWVLAGGQMSLDLGLVMIGGTLLYAGGCTLNDACDARWDRAHKPTRIIPRGAMKRSEVWGLGSLEMSVGLVFFIVAAPRVWFLPTLLSLAILGYDLHHKETPWSVVVMGACRALLVLSVAGVAGDWHRWQILVAAALLWFYIITLSLLARREARSGGGFLRALRPAWSVGRWVSEMLGAIPLVDAALLLGLGPGCWGAVAFCIGCWPLCRLLQRKYAAT